MSLNVLVTGATGTAGSAVAEAMSALGAKVFGATRHERMTERDSPYDMRRLDYEDPASFEPALNSIEAMFLVAPPMDKRAAEKLIPFVDAAKQRGVEHIVFLSAFGANKMPTPLRQIEEAVSQSGVAYTILRPNFFMENFSTGALAATINQHGAIYLAAGDGKTSFISTRNIADVAAIAFTKRLAGGEYDLTGPEALDHHQVAAILSEVLERDITYHDVPQEQMIRGAIDNGMPLSAVEYLGALYSAVRAGHTSQITDEVQKLTGKAPTSFKQFARGNKNAWQSM